MTRSGLIVRAPDPPPFSFAGYADWHYARAMLRLFMVFVVGAGGMVSGIAGTSTIRKTSDVVVYKDDHFYSAFPSIVKRPNGELLVAFRRAPERRLIGEGSQRPPAKPEACKL